MLEDYCSRLQELQKDKNNFLKMKYKANAKDALEKQQNKYHKYILSQITYKNKLDSLFLLNDSFQNIMRKYKKQAFNCINKYKDDRKLTISEKQIHEVKNQISFSTSNSKSTKSVPDKEKEKSFEFNNLKRNLQTVGCRVMCRFLSQKINRNFKNCMDRIIEKTEGKMKIQFIFNKLQSKNVQLIRQFLGRLKIIRNNDQNDKNIKNEKNILNQNRVIKTFHHVNEDPNKHSFIMSLNDFSQIIPYTILQQDEQNTISQTKNIQQIDDKFKLIISSKNITCSNNLMRNQQFMIMEQTIEKLKEQLVLMRGVLCEKNKELKGKDQEMCKMKKEYETKIQALHDQISEKIEGQFQNVSQFSEKLTESKRSHNQSYLIEMEHMLMGDRPHKLKDNKQNVNDQLIQKYMKESFEMRQKMDMAREMCEQFQFDSRTEEGLIMIEIIKLLTPEERLNVFVD